MQTLVLRPEPASEAPPSCRRMTGGPYFTHPPPFIPLPNELDPRRAAFSQSRSPHAAGISTFQEVAVAFRTGPAVGVGEEPRRGGPPNASPSPTRQFYHLRLPRSPHPLPWKRPAGVGGSERRNRQRASETGIFQALVVNTHGFKEDPGVSLSPLYAS